MLSVFLGDPFGSLSPKVLPVEVLLALGLVQRRVCILLRLCLYDFPVGGFCLLHFLAQDQGALSSKVILESNVSVYWELGLSVLVGLFVGRSSLLVPPLLLRLLLLSFLFFLSPPWLAPRNRRVHLAVFFSSLSRRLDDATLLPPPPSPNDPFVGKR